jgi:sucrose-6-phosphate hydrolase SacC (GH32 family)
MSGWAADVEHLTFAGSWIVDMDTSDTFFMRIYQAGGTAQSDLPGDTHQFLTIALLN